MKRGRSTCSDRGYHSTRSSILLILVGIVWRICLVLDSDSINITSSTSARLSERARIILLRALSIHQSRCYSPSRYIYRNLNSVTCSPLVTVINARVSAFDVVTSFGILRAAKVPMDVLIRSLADQRTIQNNDLWPRQVLDGGGCGLGALWFAANMLVKGF